MTRLSTLLVILALVQAAPAPSADDHPTIRFTFDKDPVGSIPSGWKIEGTNQKGALATWKVVSESTAPSSPNVLALSSVNHESGDTFNLCWTDGVRMKDGVLSVRFKAVSGKEDQGGGLIWRVKDKDNYYIARMNPLEDNFRVYFVKGGVRTQLASEKVSMPAGAWHEISIGQSGDHITCSLDGKKYLDVHDATFAAAGGIGLWTKADASSMFDDLVLMRDATP